MTATCPFCPENLNASILAENDTMYAIPDRHPVTRGHLLVIPKRHAEDYFSMTPEERRDAAELLNELRERLLREDATITGFNMGANCGRSAGQTVMHAHIHLIPRREGDTGRPHGGVRGVIPERMGY